MINNRIQKLEATIHSGRKCPVCGLRPDERGYVVVSYPEETTHDEAEHIPEVCPSCGRHTKTHIVVTYDDDPGGAGSC